MFCLAWKTVLETQYTPNYEFIQLMAECSMNINVPWFDAYYTSAYIHFILVTFFAFHCGKSYRFLQYGASTLKMNQRSWFQAVDFIDAY